MIFTLKSGNPDMSYIIGKNPGAGMIVKNLRKGKVFGWYGADDTYLVYFKDSFNNVSYSKDKDNSFEYNDLTRYNSPLIVGNILTNYFSSSYKKQHELDVDGYLNSIEFVVELTRLGFMESLFDGVKDFSIFTEKMSGDSYKVRIESNKNLNSLLNFVGLYSLFASVLGNNLVDLNKDLVTKYVNSMNNINADYKMKYMFMLKAIPNKRTFFEVKESLEQDDKHELNLMFGSTATWRRDFVFENMDFDCDVLDVGCGEGFYTLPLAKKLSDKTIYAVDIDEECLDIVKGKVKAREIDNVSTFDSIYSYKKLVEKDEKMDILLVEVIEHMEKEEAKELIKEVMRENFNKILITSPVKEFNIHYGLKDNEFRHDDHKWEGTVEEFTSLVLDCVEEELVKNGINFSYEHHMIGDMVDEYAPTQGVVISRY